MPFDLFISYSSADRPWATRLATDLQQLGVNCFLDQLRLTKGEKWEPNLLNDLLQSRHFVVLWSDNARNSDWVAEELYRFKGRIDPTGTGSLAIGRLLYAINLQGYNATLSAYQGYSDANVQQGYASYLQTNTFALGAAASQAWNLMIAEIAASVRAGVPAIPVQLSVLALTQNILQQAPPVLPEFDFVQGQNLQDFLTRLGVHDVGALANRYEQDPFQWHPFGTAETIGNLLDQILGDPDNGINTKLAEFNLPPIRWVRLDVITPPVNQLRQVAQPLFSRPALIVVDPISLFSLRIWRRYVELQPCFSNPQAAIVFLTPFAGTEPLVFLRRCLAEQGKPNLDWFRDPIPFNPAYANCGINIADQWDIRRLVLASLGRQPHSKPPSGAEPIIGT